MKVRVGNSHTHQIKMRDADMFVYYYGTPRPTDSQGSYIKREREREREREAGKCVMVHSQFYSLGASVPNRRMVVCASTIVTCPVTHHHPSLVLLNFSFLWSYLSRLAFGPCTICSSFLNNPGHHG